ncbi:MAG: OFA family MFS transporter [Armatimonadetes bacterium]|nr:OFA family MFS transporter [Armatimonadota bacterium]
MLVQMVLGTIYGFSVLVKPLAAEFTDWSTKDIQLSFTLALLTFAAVMVPAGRLQDKVGPRKPALAGAVLLFCGALLSSFVGDPSQKWLWWLSYGVLFGAGIGLAYVCPIAALAKWFPDIKGLITGVAVAGFGGGAAIFAPTVSPYLESHGLQHFFLTHAIICGVVVAFGAMLLRNPPADWTPPAKAATAATRAKPPVADLDWQQMLRTPRFWMLWLMFAGSSTAGLMTIGVIKVAAGKEMGDALAATAVSVLSIFNAFGRVFWGGVSDRVGRSLSMLIAFAIQAVVMLSLARGLTAGPAVAMVLVALVGLNFGANFALFPSATADAFGTRNLGVNYGLVFTAYGIGGTIGPMIAAYCKDSLGVFDPAYVVAGLLVAAAALGAIVVGRLDRPRPPVAPNS